MHAASTEFLVIFRTKNTFIVPHGLLNYAWATRAYNEPWLTNTVCPSRSRRYRSPPTGSRYAHETTDGIGAGKSRDFVGWGVQGVD